MIKSKRFVTRIFEAHETSAENIDTWLESQRDSVPVQVVGFASVLLSTDLGMKARSGLAVTIDRGERVI